MKIIISAAMVLFLAACASPTYLSERERSDVIDRAREFALTNLDLLGEERIYIEAASPQIRYYFMSRPYADYAVSWTLTEDERIIVAGRGDIFALEGATLSRTDSLTNRGREQREAAPTERSP